MRAKVTAIIPTFNEAPNIRDAIQSVAWADEIIVVDSYSTDGTAGMVREHQRVRFVQHEYENSATQKNWIIPQASHEWIFLLDADERVPEALKLEVFRILERGGERHAYWIPRENLFLGRTVKHALKGDKVIRLFKRDTCRYQNLAVHAEIETDYPVGQLKNSILHYSYRDSRHFLQKMERYAEWSARDHSGRTRAIGFWHLLVKPWFRFCKHYVFNLGFLDGRAGFIVSAVMAWGVFLRYLKLIELRQKSANREA